ncbi:MAG: hypothetical protein PVF58_17055 [Candidatus Methanofastidiosia archaeon]|jgi:hypothetical protein
MHNIDNVAKLIKEDAKDQFSKRADQEFCELLEYGHEFRKEFMVKRTHAFS